MTSPTTHTTPRSFTVSVKPKVYSGVQEAMRRTRLSRSAIVHNALIAYLGVTDVPPVAAQASLPFDPVDSSDV